MWNTTRSATPYEVYRDLASSQTALPLGQLSMVNQHRFADPETDSLLEQFAATSDDAEQKDISNRLQARFAEVLPVVPLYEYPDWGLYTTNRVTGFPNADDPYAPLSLQTDTSTFLVYPHLKPVE